MHEIACGKGRIFTDPHPDHAREFFRTKSRAMTNKVMSVSDAVSRFVRDGDYLASGGFGTNRIAVSALHELLRQKKQDLGLAGHTTTHDFEILCAGNLGGGKLLLTWFASSLFRTWDTGKPPYAATSDKLDDKFVGSWVRLSDDAGASWGDPIRVSVSAPHGPAMLKNGDLLYLGKDFSGDMDYFTRADGPIAALRSSDGGKTWTRQGTVPMCAGTVDANYCEPHVVELNDGRLLGMIRMEGGDAEILPERVTSPGFSLMQTISEDGGKTWTEAYPLGFAGSPPHLMLHSSGAVVCAYGYRSEPCSERAMISRDGGKSWDYDYILNYAPDWDLGYPSSVEMPDGSIFTMYYQKVKDENEKCGLMWTRWQLPE